MADKSEEAASSEAAGRATGLPETGASGIAGPGAAGPVAETETGTQKTEDSSADSSGESTNLVLARTRSNPVLHDSDRAQLQRIATAISEAGVDRSKSGGGGGGSGAMEGIAAADDERLQPQSPKFDLSFWLESFIRNLRGQGQPHTSPGVVFNHLNVSGSAPDLQLQHTVATMLAAPVDLVRQLFSRQRPPNKLILHDFCGLLQSGELLVVLGRPGSGCSTLLKSMTGELYGLHVDKGSTVHYNGVPQSQMMKEYRGEVIYNQEVDKHLPELTVGQTLEFAASVRMPANHWGGKNLSRNSAAKYVAQIVMAVCGLSHTYNTRVGNEFIRGVSGGERKRVSIAEMMVAGSPLMAWDNSTRGLDSASAFKFVQTLRISADLAGMAHAVAIYQASESIYELFDKAVVLHQGREIFFGPANTAKAYFERQGWFCPARQTTGDFLTSVTNPMERRPRPGMEDKVPRTPEEFEAYWLRSPEYQQLQAQIEQVQQRFPIDPRGPTAAEFHQTKTYKQAKHVRPKSPYLISIGMQIRLNTKRAYQRMWNVITPPVTTALICLILGLIIGSVIYGTPDATSGFYAKSSALFMAVLLNALITITEINSLYAQRPIVEKQASYAFYHPATEAIAGIIADIPIKFIIACFFNVIIYFLAGLRREPSQFFIYFLFSYTATFTMSGIFRTMAAMTKTVSQAMAFAGVFVLGLVMYTGFVIAVPQMHPWFSWIRFINPLFYTFESLISNEFHGREFTCSVIVPGYTPPIGDSWICSSVGAEAGRHTVNGDRYIWESYRYTYTHIWRNYGILLAFLVFFMTIYFVFTEINSVPSSTGEMLVYQKGHVPARLLNRGAPADDKEATAASDEKAGSKAAAAAPQEPAAGQGTVHGIPPQKKIFTWKDVVYDIEIKSEKRRLLDHVSGWVRPGTLTALMGVSGAGKTTLLDVLAERTTMGVITGDMLVNGVPRGASFQRNTGYVQQQDLHLETATVRESLRFSAMLRQPKSVSQAEKYAFVEEVIQMLNMEEFADAVVGVPGEGLNVEQRKLLTIGVELAAKPKLLLFLDEPTSGLDSQSSWAICAFLRKLTDAGQAVLCTIHQPSAMLFEQFDRLLFLAAGGKTVYFGPIGDNSRTLLDYFESHGAPVCSDTENPAEYMMDVVSKTKAGDGRDWHTTWVSSPQHTAVLEEIAQICHEKRQQNEGANSDDDNDPTNSGEFAMPFWAQVGLVTQRIFQQYWRMPTYVLAKLALGCIAGLFIGFTFFQAKQSLAGSQDIMFAVFMVLTIFSTLVQQIQPLFVTQRALYEVRERPGKMYSWKAFMIANIVVEWPYQILTGIVTFACFYYPVIGIQSSQRQGLVLLFCIQLLIYASTFAHMCIAALPDAETAGGIVTLLVMMSLIFSGVLQAPSALPGFWIFMYRVSPFTYWISGVISTQLHERVIKCSSSETSVFNPPTGYTCGEYMAPYLKLAPGSLQNPEATSGCQYCAISNADQYLSGSLIYWTDRWRNFGLLWAYVLFNIFMAILSYYVFRVKKLHQGTWLQRFQKRKQA